MNTSPQVLAVLMDPKRLAALRNTEMLDSQPEKTFDRLVELVQRLLGVPVALVSLVDDNRQFFKGARGLPEPWASQRQTPLSHSFCKHVVATGKPLMVENAPEHSKVSENLAIRDLGVIAYLGIPLRTPDGHVIGSLCAIDGETREWTPEDAELLDCVAESVMNEIAVRHQVKQIKHHVLKLHDSHHMLEQYARELEEGNASKDRLFSIVAHDLRSPLHAIVNYSEMLVSETEKAPSSRAHVYAERMDTAVDGLWKFMDNLLQWSLLQVGSLKHNPDEANVSDLVDRTLRVVLPQAEQKDLKIESNVDRSLMVFADPDLLSCVLHNLLTNALKFTESGGVVTVEVEQLTDHVQVSVTDTGVGMPQNVIRTLFSSSNTLTTAGTQGEAGNGLGLVLCRELVELNGGKIWATSEPDQGTRISFSVPLSPSIKTNLDVTARIDRGPDRDNGFAIPKPPSLHVKSDAS